MSQHTSKFGIYLNPKENTVVRITSPYWVPDPPDWVYLTDQVNSLLTTLRELVRERELTPDPNALQWGSFPVQDSA